MKMVKSLLLGSAAGLVAVAGAQAADLPVKAKPVEYVKICSIYGAGFFYIPGTDTCIKIGGWVRAEYALGETGNSHAQFIAGGGGRNNRINSTDTRFRARTVLSLDVRTQTEYGTVRAYNRFGFTQDSTDDCRAACSTPNARSSRSPASPSARRSPTSTSSAARSATVAATAVTSRSTAPAARVVFAYSATLGNGLTATIAARRRHRSAAPASGMPATTRTNVLVIGAMPGPITQGPDAGSIGGQTIGDYGRASRCPTSSARCVSTRPGARRRSLRRSHQLRGGWYGNNSTGAGANGTPFQSAPEDTFGFAVDAGIIINLPWAKGDRFYVEGAYTEGAPAYAGWSGGVQGGYASVPALQRPQRRVAATRSSSIFGNLASTGGPTGHQLTTSWTIGAGIEHYWTPALRSSVSGNYSATTFNGTAQTLFCSSPQSPIRTLGGVAPTGAVAFAGCNPDFNVWNVGTRTIWNPVPNLDVGLEVMYTKLETEPRSGARRARTSPGSGGRAVGLYAPSSEDVFSGLFRIQRNFWP